MEQSVAIAIVAPIPPPYGGMTIQGQALRDNLAAEGLAVLMVPTNPHLPFRLLHAPGIRTILQSLLFLWHLCIAVPRASVVHVFAASYFYFFARVAPAVFVARLFGRRVIVNYRGGEAFEFLARFGWLARPILRLASAITVPSPFLERCFRQQNLPSWIVRNLIDLDRFQFRRRERVQPCMLVSRNLEPMYNLPMALHAFKIVQGVYPAARLDVVGVGSQAHALKAWVEKAGLEHVEFHGAVPNQEMPGFLDRADVLLNPTNVDNLPANLLEAFASGVPVVSTNVGGIPDLIGDEPAALLVNAGDAQAMAEKILLLIDNPEQAQPLITAGRRIAEDFTWSHVREALFNVYFPFGGSGLLRARVESKQA